jgi:hypothetical protein
MVREEGMQDLWDYLTEAEGLAQSLRRRLSDAKLSTTEQDLIPFLYSAQPEEPGA